MRLSQAPPTRPVTHSTRAVAKKPITSGFYRGRTIGYYDFGPIKLKPGNKLAPIWTVTNRAAGQHNIVDTVPGKSGLHAALAAEPGDVQVGSLPHVLALTRRGRSRRARGEVTIIATKTIVNCPVLGFGQKRVAGFSAGKTIHYYDLGPVKVAPGNDVLPLVASATALQDSTTSPRRRSRRRNRLPAALGDRQRHLDQLGAQAPAHVLCAGDARRKPAN